MDAISTASSTSTGSARRARAAWQPIFLPAPQALPRTDIHERAGSAGRPRWRARNTRAGPDQRRADHRPAWAPAAPKDAGIGHAIELTMAVLELMVITRLATGLVAIARRPVLLAAIILAFVASAILCLALSGVVLRGWWQGLFQNVGVALLFVGVVKSRDSRRSPRTDRGAGTTTNFHDGARPGATRAAA